MSKKKFRMSVKQRVAKGNYRIAKLNIKLNRKYAGVPNVLVYPSYGWGTGVDFLVAQGNKIFELREVTNFDRFDQNGKPEYINEQRKNALITSLTRKLYWKSFGISRKRFYITENTKRYLDISYESNLPPKYWKDFKSHGIDPIVWNKTDYPRGYTVEDSNRNKRLFLSNGTEVKFITPIM